MLQETRHITAAGAATSAIYTKYNLSGQRTQIQDLVGSSLNNALDFDYDYAGRQITADPAVADGATWEVDRTYRNNGNSVVCI